MIEVSHEVEIPAPPQQVWEALVGFDSYPEWNPYVAVRGAVGSGKEIEWSYGSPSKRRIWTVALITECDEPHVLAWWFGVGWVFRVDERFSLQAIPGGTRLRHEAACRGLIAILLGGGVMRKRLSLIVTSANEGLNRHLKARIRASPAAVSGGKAKRASVRKGRRQARSRRR